MPIIPSSLEGICVEFIERYVWRRIRVLAVSFYRSVNYSFLSFILFFFPRMYVIPLLYALRLPANIRRGRQMSDPFRRRLLCIYSARLPARLQ